MRKLKHHEQKLLKKVDFLTWKTEDNLRENSILRRYHITKREDYIKCVGRASRRGGLASRWLATRHHPHPFPRRRYNKLAGHITSLVAKLKALPQDNALRVKTTEALLTKLYNLGLVPVANSLAAAERIAASAFCRRRLPVVMMRLKFAESLREAVQFVEQVRPWRDPLDVPIGLPCTSYCTIQAVAASGAHCLRRRSASLPVRPQGHIRVGPEVVTDPAYLVSRTFEGERGRRGLLPLEWD
jgi:U3 small nucleolar ribonucleoprotein protein IMP3